MLLLGPCALAAQPQTDAGRIADQAIKQRFGTETAPPTRSSTDVATKSASPANAVDDFALPGQEKQAQHAVAREGLALGAPARSDPAVRPVSKPGLMDHWLVRTAGALALVVGLMVACKKFFVRLSLGSGGVASQFGPGGKAPSGVLEILGRYPVARGHTLVLLKMDRRVLLLGHSAQGFQTLSEMTDADEVASLLVKTRDEEGESMTARFNALLRGMERDPATIGEEASPRRTGFVARSVAEAPEVVARRPGLSAAASELADKLEAIRHRGKGIRA